MNTKQSRKPKQEESWPRRVKPGRASVGVYRRRTPSGNFSFMVENYLDGERRRYDCYRGEAEALEAAEKLAKRIDARDYVAAGMTKEQSIEYADGAAALKPFGVSVRDATSTVALCLPIVGDLSNLHAAAKAYARGHKQTTKKPVAELVADFLEVKGGRGASDRYLKDLKSRLERFADGCKKDAVNVTTADIQDWLDGEKLKPQNFRNFRTVLHTLFSFAVARAYAADNPVEGVERVKVNGGDVQVFTPVEIGRLLDAARVASPDFVPCVALGAFAGLRSAEIERLEWHDINFAEKFIVVGKEKSKTASRRIVPLHDNLAAWLADYASRRGNVWPHDSIAFYKQMPRVAAATAVAADAEKGIKEMKPVKWKANALRHSYASYRFSITNDAGRVAGELGNSAKVVYRHYRELVRPAAAVAWFAIKPQQPDNVLTISESRNA